MFYHGDDFVILADENNRESAERGVDRDGPWSAW